MHQDTRKGIVAMTAGIGCLVLNDSLVKLLGGRLATPQIMCIRGVFASALLLLIACAMRTHVPLRALTHPRVLARATLDTLASAAFIASLPHLPLANATAINAATPVILTLMAVVGLREHVGAKRWSATAAGFVGVLLVVQPTGDGFNAWSLLCLLATLLGSSRDFTTRLIDRNIPSAAVTITNAAFVTLAAAAWCSIELWVPTSPSDFLILAAAGGSLACGYWLITVAMRSGETSSVVPFRYSGLLFASMLGFLGWGEIPNSVAWLGMGLLVLAGIHIARRA